MSNKIREEILSKQIMDSEVWYDHEYDCYKVRVDIWPKYYTDKQRKKSLVITLSPEDLYWVTDNMVVPLRPVARK